MSVPLGRASVREAKGRQWFVRPRLGVLLELRCSTRSVQALGSELRLAFERSVKRVVGALPQTTDSIVV